ncbi:unnamed protein product [Phytophthora fragariaefolia]|uniref:Unnamed protein product n=1 Tax=Phytophthora fragariaefolia TaxID=1490495 RepID=A0A9W7CMY9_9STRA|nr:unnamed protein product [Phytophthora fragariaefolia]
MWNNSSYDRKPDISQICTTIDWQITDLCESYENEKNPLFRLARTGFVMQRIVDLHVLIDEASATYGISESEYLKDWRLHLQAERDWRMEAFASCLEKPGDLSAILNRYRCNSLELLTLLSYDFGKYSESVFTPNEREVISGVYDGICDSSGACVVSVPKWFIPRHEITERNGDYLWQNVNVEVRPADAWCIDRTAIWSNLNHPHVARLLGACHVGFPALFIFEESASITQSILRRLPVPGAPGDVWSMHAPHRSLWDLLLGTAMGLQYLHERGIVCGNITPDKLIVNTTSNIAHIFGGDVVMLSRPYPPVKNVFDHTSRVPTMASDVREFGLCILTILHDIATLDYSAWSWQQQIGRPKVIKALPERPNYVDDDSMWHLLAKMCDATPAGREDMAYVVQQLQNVVNGRPTLQDNQLGEPVPSNTDHTVAKENQFSTIIEYQLDNLLDEDFELNVDSSCGSLHEAKGVNFGSHDFDGESSDTSSNCSANEKENMLRRRTELKELGVFGKARANDKSDLVFVETLDNYEHPECGSTIKAILRDIEDQLVDIESPGSPMDHHVFERLTSIHVHLQSLSKCRLDLLETVLSLASSFKWSLAERVDSNSLASRTIVSRGIGHRSLAFHHSIDHLLLRFRLPEATNRTHSWKHRWDYDHQADLRTFDTVLKDPEYFAGLQDDERAEIATLLAFEINRRNAVYSDDTIAVMIRALKKLQHPSCGEATVFPDLPQWFVPWHDVEVLEYLSSGSFGSVHRGKWFEATVAVKQLFQADKKDFIREVNVWFSLNHPNVIKLFGACHVGTPFFLSEYAENGTLTKFARTQKWQDWVPGFAIFGRPRNPVWAALYNVAKGLHHLHQRGIIHGDLKGNNILVGADRKAKLTDFGLSVFARHCSSEPKAPVGAVRWKAPERLGDVDSGPSFESDIFSFGMCVIELVSGKYPWINIGSDSGVLEAVLQGKLPQRPAQFADDEWGLVLRMCCFDPSERISSFTAVMLLRSYVGRLA